MLATVVIPTFNRARELGMVLAALQQQTMQDFAILIVDNSSVDNTVEVVAAEKKYWGERLDIEVKEPNGPASARNLGMHMADSEFIVFLDSDVELASDWMEKALGRLQSQPSVAAVGGKILYAFDRERLNAYGGDLGVIGLAWDVLEGEPEYRAGQPQPRIWINCSAMMARRDVCQQVGGFDEEYFYGYEDSDIGWRMNLAGHGVWVYPDQRAYHHVKPDAGSTNPVIVFHYCKNRLRSLLKDCSLASLLPMLIGYTVYSLLDFLLRSPRKPKVQALWWNLRHLRESLALRASIQQQRVTGDLSIFRLGSRRFFPPTPLGAQRRRSVDPPSSYNPINDARGSGDDRV